MNPDLNTRHPIDELAEEFVERLRLGEHNCKTPKQLV